MHGQIFNVKDIIYFYIISMILSDYEEAITIRSSETGNRNCHTRSSCS